MAKQESSEFDEVVSPTSTDTSVESEDIKKQEEILRNRERFKKVLDYSNEKTTLFQHFCLSIWLGWMGFYFFLPFILLVGYYYRSKIIFTFLGIIFSSGLFTAKIYKQPDFLLDIGSYVLTHAAKYFKARVLIEKEAYEYVHGTSSRFKENKNKNCIALLEPHDVLPVAIYSFTHKLNLFPTQRFIGCVTSICFLLPGMKHAYTWASATSVDKKTVLSILDRGHSPVICPGGAQEVTYLTSSLSNDKSESLNKITLFLKSRFGVFKLAKQYKIPLLPTFAFNQRPAFDYYVPSNRFLHYIGRKIGFIPIMITGAFGIPFNYPKSTAITYVVGDPIFVEEKEGQTEQEALQDAMDRYVQSLFRIFETFKDEYGMSEATLEIN